MKRRYPIIALLVVTTLASSPIAIKAKPYYISPILLYADAPPMSLYHYDALTVWRMARAVEYQYQIPTDLLVALITWESNGKMNAFNLNRDGSWDSGPVQLNSASLPVFQRRYNGGIPINPCSLDAIRIAGKKLADSYNERHSWRDALSLYNIGQKDYADCIFRAYLRLKRLD